MSPLASASRFLRRPAGGGWLASALAMVAAVQTAVAAPSLVPARRPDLDRALPPSAGPRPGMAISPYVQAVGPDSATICFETGTAVAARIVVGGPGGEVSLDDDVSRIHQVRAAGLEPDTEYRYRVTAGGAEAGGVFRTWPTSPARVRFFVYGDTRTNPDRHREVCAAMLTRLDGHLGLIHSGDFVASGDRHELWKREFFDPGRELFARLAVWPCPGNHEHRSDFYTAYFVAPGPEWYYGFTAGPVRFTLLDLYDDLQGGSDWWTKTDQGRWLAGEMTAAEAHPWRILVLHSPFYSLGPHGRLENGAPKEEPMRFARAILEPAMRTHGYAVAFSGHDHLYERSTKDGLVMITSGGGGAPTYSVSPNPEQNPHSRAASDRLHVCEIDATATELSITALGTDGRAFDRVVLTRSADGSVSLREGLPTPAP